MLTFSLFRVHFLLKINAVPGIQFRWFATLARTCWWETVACTDLTTWQHKFTKLIWNAKNVIPDVILIGHNSALAYFKLQVTDLYAVHMWFACNGVRPEWLTCHIRQSVCHEFSMSQTRCDPHDSWCLRTRATATIRCNGCTARSDPVRNMAQ